MNNSNDNSNFVEKATEWIEKTGFTSMAYLAIAVVCFVFLEGWVQWFLSGAALGIFFYVNANVIWKLATGKTDDKKV